MFSRPEQLARKTGEDGIGRYEYLRDLIKEFTTTDSIECKYQVLANLANFAYDPINYVHFKQLHIVDLFLAQLSEDDEELVHFALAGLCNLICDPESREYIITFNGVNLISNYLCSTHEEIALNAITTLYHLFEDPSAIFPPGIYNKILLYKNSTNTRFKNLGILFLERYQQQIHDNKP